jgi:hypothetical protein
VDTKKSADDRSPRIRYRGTLIEKAALAKPIVSSTTRQLHPSPPSSVPAISQCAASIGEV